MADGDAAVADCLKLDGEIVWWDGMLRREVQDWELESLGLFEICYAMRDMGR